MKINFHLYSFYLLCLTITILYGCPKSKIEIKPHDRPAFVNPFEKILMEFSKVDSFQSKTSIRIESERSGEEIKYLLDGIILFHKPDRLRILGFHPLGISIFDALYYEGQLLIFIPFQKKAYIGEISKLDEMMEKAGEIIVTSEKVQESEIPGQINIEAKEIGIRFFIKLKDISLNPDLSEETFAWNLPEGIEIRPISRLLRGKILR